MIGFDETLPVTRRHDIYPAIDPTAHFRAQTFTDAVVLVTGASRGIGLEIALHYARAGARLALVARDQEGLDQTRGVISRERPDAQVLTFALDVRDGHKAEDAVNATVARFGRIDVLVANAGVLTSWDKPLSLKCPDAWWNTFEVNTRGVFNFVRPSLHLLEKTAGYIVVISAEASHMRFPGASDYHISKHAINRLVEYIVLEHPKVKAFSVHPGVVKSDLSDGTGWEISTYDSPRLSAASLLYLTSGRADWLSGRYVSVNWDLAEVERDWKAKIMDQHGLVSKLHIPQ
ncbi:NAD-P-binding protein [Amylostereum chailletii]|nr:NAD-P-binding protein [Amylostereum chailletii]